MEDKFKIAVFIDFDNIEIGVKSTLQREFDVAAVLDALKERGEIVTKIAYANWGRQETSTRQLAEHAVQMVQRDPSPRGDKNGADINLALDALEMAFTHDHINAFCIVSGDSDFIALVNKLKQYDKTIFVVGGKAFTSTILQKNCHEFISYESLLEEPRSRAAFVPAPQQEKGGGPRGGDARGQQQRLDIEEGVPADELVYWVREEAPAFDWKNFGFQEFSEFLNYSQDKTVVRIVPDETQGLLVYLGAEFHPPAVQEPEPQPVAEE